MVAEFANGTLLAGLLAFAILVIAWIAINASAGGRVISSSNRAASTFASTLLS